MIRHEEQGRTSECIRLIAKVVVKGYGHLINNRGLYHIAEVDDPGYPVGIFPVNQDIGEVEVVMNDLTPQAR